MKRLLDKLMLVINYETLLDSDIEIIVKKSRGYFFKKGYELKESMQKNYNIQIDDPQKVDDSLKTEVVPKHMFVFSNDNVTVSISRNAMDVTVNASKRYAGFAEYQELLMEILRYANELEGNVFKISRIGVRKINNLFLKNIELINKYFFDGLFGILLVKNRIDKVLRPLYGSRINSFIGNNHKVNLSSEIQLGEGRMQTEAGEEKINVYRIVLDIDVYVDKETMLDDRDYGATITKLSNKATEIYRNCLNEDFYREMETDALVTDENVFGGINQ